MEIKSFINQSTAYDFHNALGQYLVYQTGLEVNNEEGDLFLAVPNDTFNTFFSKTIYPECIEKI